MVKFVIAKILAGMLLGILIQAKINKGKMIFEVDVLQANERCADKPIEVLPSEIVLWSDRVIPYEFHHSVDQSHHGIVREAMDNWEKATCITFVPRTNQRNFLRFRTDIPKCSSFTGRIEVFEGQDIKLGGGCIFSLRKVMHEIGHSLGFFHEHSREDRDSVIKILWHNIVEGWDIGFALKKDDRRDERDPYDVTSIMHYNTESFSIEKYEKNTMVTKNPHHQRLIGSGQKISFWDAKFANKMYSCNAFCTILLNETTQCQNGGYLSPYKGNNSWCHCICPPETYGTYCENTRNADYYGPPICGGNVTEEQEIQTPGYPKRESPNNECSWWIQAPPRKRVMVTFLDFRFYPRVRSRTSEFRGRCATERVEIRTISMLEGNMYCGKDIDSGSSLVSEGDEFIIIITTTPGLPLQHYQHTRGLKAKVSFID